MMATGGACSTLSSEPSRLLYDREGSLFRFSRRLLCRPHALADLAQGRHADHRRRQGPRHHVHRPHSAPPITQACAPPKPAANTWGAGHRRLARSGHRRWRSGGHPTAGGSHRRWSQVDLGACGGHLRLASASRSWIGFTVANRYGWSATRCAVLKLRRPSLGWLTPRM